MKTKKRSVKLLLIGAACLLCFAVLLLVNGIVNYVQGVGEICVNDYSTVPNSTVSIDKLAVWENVKAIYITDARWDDGSKTGLTVAADGQSLEIGDQTGEITAVICADSRSPEAQGRNHIFPFLRREQEAKYPARHGACGRAALRY